MFGESTKLQRGGRFYATAEYRGKGFTSGDLVEYRAGSPFMFVGARAVGIVGRGVKYYAVLCQVGAARIFTTQFYKCVLVDHRHGVSSKAKTGVMKALVAWDKQGPGTQQQHAKKRRASSSAREKTRRRLAPPSDDSSAGDEIQPKRAKGRRSTRAPATSDEEEQHPKRRARRRPVVASSSSSDEEIVPKRAKRRRSTRAPVVTSDEEQRPKRAKSRSRRTPVASSSSSEEDIQPKRAKRRRSTRTLVVASADAKDQRLLELVTSMQQELVAMKKKSVEGYQELKLQVSTMTQAAEHKVALAEQKVAHADKMVVDLNARLERALEHQRHYPPLYPEVFPFPRQSEYAGHHHQAVPPPYYMTAGAPSVRAPYYHQSPKLGLSPHEQQKLRLLLQD